MEKLTELVKLIVGEIQPVTVAEAAANHRALADIFTCVVRDAVMPDITVGHALVVVAYGSEVSINRIKQVLIDAGSSVL